MFLKVTIEMNSDLDQNGDSQMFENNHLVALAVGMSVNHAISLHT